MTALRRRNIDLDAPIQELSVLALRSRLVVERIAAGVVIQLIFPDVRINRQQRAGIEGVLIAGSDAPREHALPLILAQLVKAIRDLEPVPRRKQVQVEDILAAWLEVEAVEKGLIVADIMNVFALGRVQEAFRAHTVDGQEISNLRVAKAQSQTATSGPERSKIRADVTKRSTRAKTGTSRDLRNQTGLIAEFNVRSSRGHLHALDRAGWKLGGIDLALLVANGLSVDQEAGLGMIA